MHERQDPGARLPALRQKARGAAPDREEGLLHRVLRKSLVTEDANREPVGDAAVAVVQLRKRNLVRPRGQRNDRLVGEMGKCPGHC